MTVLKVHQCTIKRVNLKPLKLANAVVKPFLILSVLYYSLFIANLWDVLWEIFIIYRSRAAPLHSIIEIKKSALPVMVGRIFQEVVITTA